MSIIFIQHFDEDVRTTLQLVLELEGYSVFTFGKCDESLLNAIDVYKPDLIMLDFYTNGMDCCRIRPLIKERNPKIPVLALCTSEKIKTDYQHFNFTDYIQEPFDLRVLYKVIKKNLEESSLNQS